MYVYGLKNGFKYSHSCIHSYIERFNFFLIQSDKEIEEDAILSKIEYTDTVKSSWSTFEKSKQWSGAEGPTDRLWWPKMAKGLSRLWNDDQTVDNQILQYWLANRSILQDEPNGKFARTYNIRTITNFYPNNQKIPQPTLNKSCTWLCLKIWLRSSEDPRHYCLWNRRLKIQQLTQ